MGTARRNGYRAAMATSLLSARPLTPRRSLLAVGSALLVAATLTLTPLAHAGRSGAEPDRKTPFPTFKQRAGALVVDALRVGRDLQMPTDVAGPPGSSDLYVAEKCGTIRLLRGGENLKAGSIRKRTSCDSERGLLSIAFHPDFATNKLLYLFYTRRATGDLQLAEVTVSGARVQAGTLRPLLRIRHRQAANHNGGDLAFGRGGMLYLSTGDGGGGGNEFGHAQRLNSLLGKVLRINVDRGDKYAIPKSNPLRAGQGRREIYALGLRNPWRMSWDAPTRSLWIGDVGQSQVEEIDRLRTGKRPLRNLGWSRYEGRSTYDASAPLSRGKLIWPVKQYRHPQGESVIGGAVYRGTRSPALQGYYVYGDFNGWIAGFDVSDPASSFRWNPGREGLLTISSGPDRELYAGYADGTLWRIAARAAEAP